MNKNKLFRWSIVAALAGFIFGFDTVVISGANQPIKELWHTSPLFHGFFIMSMALWGTVLGAIFAGYPTEKFGRKKVLLWLGILYTISALVLPSPLIRIRLSLDLLVEWYWRFLPLQHQLIFLKFLDLQCRGRLV
jgi:MFS family permease